jgi:hypothetical protein
MASRASFVGRRRGSGVTNGPSRIRFVAKAIAARATQGSMIGVGQATV